MVKTLHFHCRGHGFIPGQGTKIPVWPKKKKKKQTLLSQRSWGSGIREWLSWMVLVPGPLRAKLPSSVGTGESASRLTPVIAAGVRFLLAVPGDFSSPHRLSECPHDVTAACPRVSNERARDGSHSLLQPHLGSGYNTARAGHSAISVTQSNSGM